VPPSARKFLTPVELPGDPASGLQASTKDYVDAGVATRVPTTRSVVAGTGLTGGGALSADRTLTVAYGSASGTAVQGNDARVSVVPFAPVPLTDGATIATDASLGNHFRVTLAGNRTLSNPTNPTDGQRCIWELIQDGTGSRTITLGSAFALGTDLSVVNLTATAAKRDFLGAIYNSTASKWFVIALSRGY
jgi:hypothetical protein